MKLLQSFQRIFEAMKKAESYQERTELEKKLRSLPKATRAYKINCTGNVCRGDKILFVENRWEKAFGCRARRFRSIRWVHAGYNLIEAVVLKDSYGQEKGQHTFTLLLPDKTKKLIKGRNLYAIGVWRKAWKDEQERKEVLEDKYRRGAEARRIKQWNLRRKLEYHD